RRGRRRGRGRGDRPASQERSASSVPPRSEFDEAEEDQIAARARQRLEENDEDLADIDQHDDEHDDEHGHTKIPTWQETVGMLIEANMASRSRDRDHGGGGGGGRGRGRGRGR
ncbi:MAG: hypothetical protein K8R36_04100, partial [Planctomycetales bacterium]|nr:hypothetical protein [Planctomycetales bacterium]